MDYTLDALNTAALSLGRAVVMIADEWDGEYDLDLTHMGETEGNVVFNANETVSGLRLRERYGDAYLRATSRGANPQVTIPLVLADPTLRDLVSPTGTGVIGTDAGVPVAKKTLVIFPEALFYNALTASTDAKIRYTTADGWQKSAVEAGDPDSFAALTADEERLLGLSVWVWSGYFSRPPYTYQAQIPGEDEVLNVEEVTFQGMRPENVFAMVTIGDPADHGIEIDVA